MKLLVKEFDVFDSACEATRSTLVRHEDYVSAYVVLQVIGEAFGFEVPELVFVDQKDSNIKKVRAGFQTVETNVERLVRDVTIRNTRNRLLGKFPGVFAYTFTDGDFNRIQTIISELRQQIGSAALFTPDHRARLLKKLEDLQAELHKRVSSLDRFWGFRGDAGIALGKFGKDAKPIFDRAREMAEIAWRTQAKAEELESGTPFPLLSPPKDDDKS